MGTKIDNVKRFFGAEPGGKWKVNSKEAKRDSGEEHWRFVDNKKYRVRVVGIHNPTRGIVYRKTRVKRSTFRDPEWRKANPKLYKMFAAPPPKKIPPLNKYMKG